MSYAEKMQPKQVKMPPAMIAQLARRARELDRSVSWLIREYVRRGLEANNLPKVGNSKSKSCT